MCTMHAKNMLRCQLTLGAYLFTFNVSCLLRFQLALRASIIASQRALCAYMLMCQLALLAYMLMCFVSLACFCAYVPACLEFLPVSLLSMPFVFISLHVSVPCKLTYSCANMPWLPCLLFKQFGCLFFLFHCQCC